MTHDPIWTGLYQKVKEILGSTTFSFQRKGVDSSQLTIMSKKVGASLKDFIGNPGKVSFNELDNCCQIIGPPAEVVSLLQRAQTLFI